MVAGHLTLKNGRYYAVRNYIDAEGQRKTKWISLGLPEKGNKRKAEAALARLRAEFEPPKEAGDLSNDMLFADYLLEWLEIAKGRLAVATYSSYATMIKKPIGPYFRKKESDLAESGSPSFADVLFGDAQKSKSKYGHSLSRNYPLGTEICGQDRYADPECGGQGGPAQKEQLSAGLSFGGGNAEDV